MKHVIRLGLLSLVAFTGTAAHALSNNVVQTIRSVTPSFTEGFSDSIGPSPAPPVMKTYRDPNTNAVTSLSFNFYDDYIFTMSGASDGSLSAAAVSINLGSLLGIDNLQARIYSIASAADLTNDSPASGTLAQAWSQPFNSGGLTGTTLAFGNVVPLQAGQTYALEFRGLVTGSAGGSYGGNLNITPVPEASGWALAMVGLGLLTVGVRKRSA